MKNVANAPTVSKADMIRAQKVIADQRLLEDQEFAGVFNEVKHLSDDELLERLGPWLRKRDPDSGRPSGQPHHILIEKQIMAHRLRNRGLTYTEIAKTMILSDATVMKLLRGAKKQLMVNPDSIDIPQEIGHTLNLYEDIRGMAMAVASGGKYSPNQKMLGATIALQAMRDRVEFLKTIGVFTPQLTTVLQTLVIGSLKVQLGKGEHDMSKAVQGLAKMLMEANLQELQTLEHTDLQSIAPVYDKDEVLVGESI